MSATVLDPECSSEEILQIPRRVVLAAVEKSKCLYDNGCPPPPDSPRKWENWQEFLRLQEYLEDDHDWSETSDDRD